MNQEQQGTDDPKNAVKAIRVFFKTTVIGPLLVAAVIIAIKKFGNADANPLKDTENIFLIVAVAVAIGCFIAARRLYDKNIEPAKDPLISLQDKLNKYRATLIMYTALCEGPSLLSIILLFMTGNYLFLIITAAMIVAMLTKSPTSERLVADLNLSSQEEQALE